MNSLRLAAGRAEWRGRVLIIANLLLAFVSAVLLTTQLGAWNVTYTVRRVESGYMERGAWRAQRLLAECCTLTQHSNFLSPCPRHRCCHLQNQLRIVPGAVSSTGGRPPLPTVSAELCLGRRGHYASLQRGHYNLQRLRELRAEVSQAASVAQLQWQTAGGRSEQQLRLLVAGGLHMLRQETGAGLQELCRAALGERTAPSLGGKGKSTTAAV